MKKVSVVFANDEDRLRISEIPWWMPAYERVVDALFCPCHGISGFLSRMEWYEVLTYRVWNRLLSSYFKFEKVIVSIPIESGCVIAQALWKDHNSCWRDDCLVDQEA